MAFWPGAVTKWQWPNLTVEVRAERDRLRIGQQMVVIERVIAPALHGRTRVEPWFRCPECGRRCGKLHFVAGIAACRLCHKLDYASRHRNRYAPAVARIARLQRVLVKLRDGHGTRYSRRAKIEAQLAAEREQIAASLRWLVDAVAKRRETYVRRDNHRTRNPRRDNSS